MKTRFASVMALFHHSVQNWDDKFSYMDTWMHRLTCYADGSLCDEDHLYISFNIYKFNVLTIFAENTLQIHSFIMV